MSRGVNKVILLGVLGQDPKETTFDKGGKIVTFPMVTNEYYKDKDGVKQERAEWHNIVIGSGSLCDIATQYLHKGDTVYVEGKIQSREYVDKEGIKRKSYDIRIDTLTMIATKISDKSTTQTAANTSTEPELLADEDLPF